MHTAGTTIDLSASDLSRFLGCHYCTALDLQVARGLRSAPHWVDQALELLKERGLEHEKNYVEKLQAQGREVVDLRDYMDEERVVRTLEAMRAGVGVIVQAALRDGRWFGKPDVLFRVNTPSNLGPYSYEAVDTKLARETRGGTVLQLALYSELLGKAQGHLPEHFRVVTPDPEEPEQVYRVHDFGAYCRLVRARLEAAVARDPGEIAAASYPDPVEQCEVCRWFKTCDKRRHDDDHLSLVAGISRLQICELQNAEVATLAQLAALPIPVPFKPHRGDVKTYERVREQARIQLEGRVADKPVHELLELVEGQGLYRLPAPSPGDIFLDLESDQFARDGGREYLFGFEGPGENGPGRSYRGIWAFTDGEERRAFEEVIDRLLQVWGEHPDMHVYHYSPYEPSAFKRLMGRHATRETHLDRMLRAELFVDLYGVVKHAVRASVERYSIKDLEPFYGYEREAELEEARPNLRAVERALELRAADAVTPEIRAVVEAYNRDDCVSAKHLRDWLEELRAAAERQIKPIPRPALKDPEPPPKLTEREERVRELMTTLLAGVPLEPHGRTEEQQASWLLANLLDWHRREDKASWWEYYRLCDLNEDELKAERAAIAQLRRVGRVGGTAKCPVDRYRFPEQECDIQEGGELWLTDGTVIGTVDSLDRTAHHIDIRKRGKQADVHPTAVFAYTHVRSEVLDQSLQRIAEDVAHSTISGSGKYVAARELLLGREPRLDGAEFKMKPKESPSDFAVRVVTRLDRTVLPIQGPPGSGKTHTAALMICELVKQGRRVGVTAVSHQVISNLLDKVLELARKEGLSVRCAQKVKEESDSTGAILETKDNADIAAWLQGGRVNVAGGTAWLWARPEYEGSVDVLVVDEAGQMSLANVLAVSPAGNSLVLLGDPSQLEQPQKGTHPEGTDRSALEHVLGDHQTMPKGRGIFLAQTWRLPPAICDFTSEVFYEGRLHPRPGLERQRLVGPPPFNGAGLWTVAVEHEGNQTSSDEEVEAAERIVELLLGGKTHWTDCDDKLHQLTADDILVVAAYNAQVDRLNHRLRGRGISVGTVDKFQGKEAPVVIYSMATSLPEDAHRGMEFLYSLSRLNVASSRARCACILVASPRLWDPDCKSPGQMRLANALCRYVEMAQAAPCTAW